MVSWILMTNAASFSLSLSISCVRIDSNGNQMISIEVSNWTYYGTNVLISLKQNTLQWREAKKECKKTTDESQ